ncbi:MAG: hypothetical protein H7138_15200, partial [Myxococcales bacterium]|nr:hypothetical protein [Myxococcales bacterium]
DMYDVANGADAAGATASYRPDFLDRFLAAQRARRDRIEERVHARLEELRATTGAPRDEAFIVYRTHADPRCLDLSLDGNERRPGSVWGDARSVNFSANAMGRTTSLTAFLSQWSSASRAGGPENLARTSVPTLLLTYTADQSTFPSTRDAWLAAGGERALGLPECDTMLCGDGRGRYIQYAAPVEAAPLGLPRVTRTRIYWHVRHGVRVVSDPILAAWRGTDCERGPLGYATAAVQADGEPGGLTMTFEHGAIFVSPTGDVRFDRSA